MGEDAREPAGGYGAPSVDGAAAGSSGVERERTSYAAACGRSCWRKVLREVFSP